MRLSDFAAEMRHAERFGTEDPEISGIAADSRAAGPGFIFAAIAGSRGNGADYIDAAVRNGAAALILPAIPGHNPGVPYLVAKDARKALGEAADLFHRHPSAQLRLVGVTGTNGKTTTAYLLRHILNHAGLRAGMLGTIEYDAGDGMPEPAALTTPDAVRFTACLAKMRDSCCKAAVVEVSSHALDQDRVYPHRFSGAVFTNLTRDHLDYHADMRAYREAKRRLFLSLDEKAVAVMNFGDPAAARLADGCKAAIMGYLLAGKPPPPGIPAGTARVEAVSGSLDGQTFAVSGHGIEQTFHTPLIGRYNIENCAGAALMAAGLGVPPEAIGAALAGFPGVPGRLERIESDGVRAFIDYSHTDDALRSAVSVIRPLATGKLITVFGCGGDRDPGKRPLMARAAEEFSDLVVVTSDNPRTEDPEKIIAAIMPGFARPERVVRQVDRPAAIRTAVAAAGPGDAILVAGKGHENYQIVGTEKRHMDDRELVRGAFASRRREKE